MQKKVPERLEQARRIEITTEEEIVGRAEASVAQSLPTIDIGVGSERLSFVERMAALATEDGQLDAEIYRNALGTDELHFVNLVVPGSAGSHKSGGQLVVQPDEKRVRVELYLADWGSHHPTRAAYVEFARSFFGPILRRYNRKFSTCHRLRVVKPKGYVMPPKTKLLFDRFITLANVRSLHAYDWERFYLFVRNSRSEVPEGHLRTLLVQNSFSPEKAQMLSELYYHLWRFKKLG